MAFRYRISILLLLLACEAFLLCSVLGRGWYETTATLYWLRALAIAAIPLAFGVFCLCQGGRRLSLRSLMILVACVAVFITIAMLPLLNAQRSRMATMALLDRGASMETATFTSGVFRHIGSPQIQNSSPDFGESPLSIWLRPLAGRLLDTPNDAQIREVTISNDEQMSLLLENATKFDSLETILLYGPTVHSSSITNLCNSLDRFSALKTIHFGNVAIPDKCLSKMTGVRYLSIHARNPPPRGLSGFRLTNAQLETIGNLPSLEVLSFCDYDLTDDDLSLLSPGRSLKHMTIYGADVTDSGMEDFASAHPNCELNRR